MILVRAILVVGCFFALPFLRCAYFFFGSSDTEDQYLGFFFFSGRLSAACERVVNKTVAELTAPLELRHRYRRMPNGH